MPASRAAALSDVFAAFAKNAIVVLKIVQPNMEKSS
jgi:hypothetical protein